MTRDLIEVFDRRGRTLWMPANIFDMLFDRMQLDLMGIISCGYNRDCCWQQEMLEEVSSQSGTRVEQVNQTEDELILAHERYLPQFVLAIAELKRHSVTVKEEQVPRLMEDGRQKQVLARLDNSQDSPIIIEKRGRIPRFSME